MSQFSDSYASGREQLDKLEAVMEGMATFLDIPPVEETEALQDQLGAAIKSLDVSAIVEARNRVLEHARQRRGMICPRRCPLHQKPPTR